MHIVEGCARKLAISAAGLDWERLAERMTNTMSNAMGHRAAMPAMRLARRGVPLGVAVLVVLALCVAGCGPLLSVTALSVGEGTSAPYGVVEVGISTFLQRQVTIKAGQSVRFVDPPSGGGVHFICVGERQRCQPTSGTPAALANPNGLYIANGQAPISVPFKTPGVYQVICTIHPEMEVSIVVK
jgi:plastocyanin